MTPKKLLNIKVLSVVALIAVAAVALAKPAQSQNVFQGSLDFVCYEKPFDRMNEDLKVKGYKMQSFFTDMSEQYPTFLYANKIGDWVIVFTNENRDVSCILVEGKNYSKFDGDLDVEPSGDPL